MVHWFNELILCVSILMVIIPAATFGAEPAPPVPNDGTTDVTAPLQALIDEAAKTGGEVYLPPGLYLVKGSLLLPTGVTLRGSWQAPHHGAYTKGTTLLTTLGKGSEEGPAFIEMRQSSALRGVTIVHSEQRSDDIQPYPWTIHGEQMHATVENVTLVNSYNGIAMGPKSNELHLIRNVFGLAEAPSSLRAFTVACSSSMTRGTSRYSTSVTSCGTASASRWKQSPSPDSGGLPSRSRNRTSPGL